MMNAEPGAAAFSAFASRLSAGESVSDIALEALQAARATLSDGMFMALLEENAVRHAAQKVQARLDAGERLPLAGIPFSVKDNIDTEGFVSSANCPGYGRLATSSAPAVIRVQRAGAILIGRNTMDQFATGLNGTRSPPPLCRNAIDPRYIPGGSSSGSAVAVARGIGGFSLGTDTGGSGRVPAAANGVVGLKPTVGLVSSRGMVYCNRSFDCIAIFARHIADAYTVLEVIAGNDCADPSSRDDADEIDLTAAPPPAEPVAVPRSADLTFFGDDKAAEAHSRNLELLEAAGLRLEKIDFSAFREAGELLFKSALVAERLVDYGDFIAENPDRVVPAVREAIDAGRGYSAQDAFEALFRIKALQRRVRHELSGYAAIIVPTIPTLFTIDEMLADPIEKNTVLGTYTYFVNPLDFCAVSVPGLARTDGLPTAICVIGRDGEDSVVRGLATLFEQLVLEERG